MVLRRTVLPGLFALATVPFAAMLLGDDLNKVVMVSILAGLVLIAHRRNLVEELSHLATPRQLDPKPDRSRL